MLTTDLARDPKTGLAASWAAVFLCLGLASAPLTAAAQSLDLDNGSNQPPAAPASPSVGGLDTDVRPDAPIPALSAGDVKAGITPSGSKIEPDATPATLTAPEPAPPAQPAPPAKPTEAAAALPGPVTLEHAKVIDTAKLQAGDTTVTLFGVEGLTGEPAQGLQAYLGQSDKPLNCQAHDGSAFVCIMGDGTDVALVALVNGAARTKAEAPDVYREQENDAQKNRRGIWAKLPPPPETVKHPMVKDTATLTADDKTYVLDDVIGLGTPYNSQLQSYITANGDSMTCMPQGPQDHFVCLLPDGTDLAKVALVNGAARVPPAATSAYLTQQLDALNNHRGYWATAPADVVALATAASPPDQYTLVSGDDGTDGITYVNGMPLVVIEGEPDPVFVVYEDDLGWGYYGRDHYWHRAPDRYWHHLDHFHHDGAGLRGYDHGHFASYGHEVRGRPGEGRGGAVHEAAFHSEGHAAVHEGGFHGEGHAAMRDSGARGGGREGGMREAGLHSQAHAGMGGRPGGSGGGFMQPARQASMGGFHQGLFGGGGGMRSGGGGMMHAGGGGGMMHAAPAAHASGGGGGGKHR